MNEEKTETAEATPDTDIKKANKKDESSGKKQKQFKGRKKKKKLKKIIIIIIILLAILAFAAYRMGFFGGGNSGASDTYNTYTVSRRDIQTVLTGTGTLQPFDSYTVTALSTGEILEDYFEEGDEVVEDQLLMRLDSSNLESSLDRAQNAYDNAKKNLDDLYDDRNDLRVTTDYAGIIQVMDLKVGDDVMQGSAIASIIDRDTMLIDIPFMQEDTFNISRGSTAVLTVGDTLEELYGTVDSIKASYSVNSNGVKTVDVTIAVKNPGVITESTYATAKIGEYSCTGSSHFYYNVNESVKAEYTGKVKTIYKDEGDYVNKGDVIVLLESKNLEDSIERSERSLREAANSLKDAKDAFDNYEITAPISGTVIEKNYKKGEKIGSSGGSSANVVAIIYDMSALKFDMNIDELDIDSLRVGQEVIVTSDAKPGKSYTGYITNISIQGSTSNGTTVYPITVTIDEYGSAESGDQLRSGMNVDAEIILEKYENVLAVPVDAVGRGNKVKVVKLPEDDSAAESGANTQSGSTKSSDGERPERAGDENQKDSFGEGGERPQNFADGEKPEGFDPSAFAERSESTSQNESAPGRRSGYSTVPKSTEYEEVTVETGATDGDYIEIVSGLSEGDVVIIETVNAASSFSWYNMGGGGPYGGGGGNFSGGGGAYGGGGNFSGGGGNFGGMR